MSNEATDFGADGGLMASANLAPNRTWPELRDEVQARTDKQVYPMTGMESGDVATILSNISSLDRDEWGRAWADMAQSWIDKGEALTDTDRQGASDAFIMAWRYAAFGGWPAAITPEKVKSYELSLVAFRKYAALQDCPIERIELEVEGGKIAFYLQLPKSDASVPVVISIGGLDSYKEYVAERYGPVYFSHGLGFAAVDAPSTGESDVLADEQGERIFSAVIDYLLTRDDVDSAKIGIQGVSLGGYWSTKTALREAERLAFAINWGGPLDKAWSGDQMRGATRSREYLFDAGVALMKTFGYATQDDLIENQHRMSIVEQGIHENPTPKMLVVNGLKDTLVPAVDTLLLLQCGAPKWSWINPQGIHIGRTPDWPDERIVREVLMPWIEMILED